MFPLIRYILRLNLTYDRGEVPPWKTTSGFHCATSFCILPDNSPFQKKSRKLYRTQLTTGDIWVGYLSLRSSEEYQEVWDANLNPLSHLFLVKQSEEAMAQDRKRSHKLLSSTNRKEMSFESRPQGHQGQPARLLQELPHELWSGPTKSLLSGAVIFEVIPPC